MHHGPSLLCSLCQGTMSLNPSYLRHPGSFGLLEGGAEDRRPERTEWELTPHALLAVASLPAALSPRRLQLPPVSTPSLQQPVGLAPGIPGPPFLLLSSSLRLECVLLLLIPGLPPCPLQSSVYHRLLG